MSDDEAVAVPVIASNGLQDANAVSRRVAVSSAVMVASRLAMRCISIVSTLILARLLMAEDFGLIGLAATVITIAEILTQTGAGMAVVRHATANQIIYDTAWTLNLLRCLLLGGLLAATAEWQAALLGDSRIAAVIMVVSLTIILDGFGSAGLYRLQRELKYSLIVQLDFLGKITAFAITIILASVMRNYWCLVLGNLAARLFIIPYTYRLAPHRPRLTLGAARELLHFSKWMLLSNACGAIEQQAANLSIGRLVGLQALGFWRLAYQVAAVPVTEVAVPVRGPVYSGYAKMQHNRDLLRQHFLAGFGLLCAVVTPLSVGIALVAPEVERLALGPAFVGTAPLIALCALYALIDALAHFTFNLFIVMNQQRKMVAAHALVVVARIPAAVFGALVAGVEGAGIAMVATAFLGAIAWHTQVARLLGHGIAAISAVVWRSFVAVLIMTTVVIVVRMLLPASDGALSGAIFRLGVLASCGACAHLLTQFLLWRACGMPNGAEKQAASILIQLAPRLRMGRIAPIR